MFKETAQFIKAGKLLVQRKKVSNDFEREKANEYLLNLFSNNQGLLLKIAQMLGNNDLSQQLLSKENDKSLEFNERKKIIEMMWQIIVTDDNFDPYENNLVWRVAELIGISTRERVQIKKDFLSTLNG